MKGNGNQQVKIPGLIGRKFQEAVFDGASMTGRYTVSAEGTSRPGAPGFYIVLVQGVILAGRSTDHAGGAARIVDVHSEGIYLMGKVNDCSNGTVRGTMNHATLPAGDNQDDAQPKDSKATSQKRGRKHRYFH